MRIRIVLSILFILIINLCLTNIAQATNLYIRDGQYLVKQVEFDVDDAEYTLFLLDSKPPNLSIEYLDLQIARLTDDEINKGKNNYLKVENGQPVLYLTDNYKIIYRNANSKQNADTVTVNDQSTNTKYERSPFAGTTNHFIFRPSILYSPSQDHPKVSLRENSVKPYKYNTRKSNRGYTKRNRIVSSGNIKYRSRRI